MESVSIVLQTINDIYCRLSGMIGYYHLLGSQTLRISRMIRATQAARRIESQNSRTIWQGIRLLSGTTFYCTTTEKRLYFLPAGNSNGNNRAAGNYPRDESDMKS